MCIGESVAQLYALTNALYSDVVVRHNVDGEAVLVPGKLICLHPEDATIDVQTEFGALFGLVPYRWATRDERVTWQWPDAPDPLDPQTFEPTHFKREPLQHPVPPKPPTPPKRSA